jgi:hypothetical protein
LKRISEQGLWLERVGKPEGVRVLAEDKSKDRRRKERTRSPQHLQRRKKLLSLQMFWNHVKSVALGSNLWRAFRCKSCAWEELEHVKGSVRVLAEDESKKPERKQAGFAQ